MRRSNLGSIILLGCALLVLPACTDSDLDDGDSANVLLQVLDLKDSPVTGDTQVGTCTVSGAQCLDNSDCDPLDPTDICFIDPSAAECIITEWQATLANTPKSELAIDTPYSDIVLTEVEVTYDWQNGFAMNSFEVPLAGTIPAGTSKSIAFFPISSEDLADLRAAFPLVSRTANITIEFRGVVENGDEISRRAGAQLYVEACN